MPGTDVRQSRIGLLSGRSPLLRLQSDERLIALIRSGSDAAFDLLFERYRTRLLGFCRHMLGSREDAEDVLQEVFAASYNAIKADSRDINVRPWLYRIARNRCLNHLRRPTQDGRDTMDDQVHAHGISTADLVSRRADFRTVLEDIQKLPETQRTALLLREMDALSYEQIAEAMDNTVPSVKSLLVRARMSLAEAAEARQLTCTDVRLELAEVAEGLKKASPAVRRHVRECEQCGVYRTQLKKTSTAMALALPLGPLLILKKLFLVKVGAGAAGAASGGATAGGAGAGGAAAAGATAAGGAGAAGAAGATAGGLAAGGSIAGAGGAVGVGAVATKAITVTAATALLAGGAVQVRNIAVPAHPQTKTPIVQEAKQPPVESGGQSAATLPPVTEVKEELKKVEEAAASKAATDEEKAVDETAAPATDPATETGTTGATGVTGPAEPVPAPVTQHSQPQHARAQSGGAALPPPATHGSPPAGAKSQPSPGSTTPAP
jgi:RNA polymerase sigma factor (sigma-70 family)